MAPLGSRAASLSLRQRPAVRQPVRHRATSSALHHPRGSPVAGCPALEAAVRCGPVNARSDHGSGGTGPRDSTRGSEVMIESPNTRATLRGVQPQPPRNHNPRRPLGPTDCKWRSPDPRRTGRGIGCCLEQTKDWMQQSANAGCCPAYKAGHNAQGSVPAIRGLQAPPFENATRACSTSRHPATRSDHAPGPAPGSHQ